MVFNYVTYISSEHAELRYMERIEPCSREEAKQAILETVQNGFVLIDIQEHRYIKSSNLFFPCVKISENIYKIKSVLTWDMVEHRLQSAVDNYVFTDLY